MAKKYPGGIRIDTPLNIATNKPVSDDQVLELVSDLFSGKYTGNVAFVLENDTLYVKESTGWKPVGYKKFIEKTYAELLQLYQDSELVTGATYLLTDYETTYIQPLTNTPKTSGVIEPLYITALDVNKLHNVCKSQLYPQDIVYYDITDASEGFTMGKIYRRIDTVKNNDIGTDWRHVMYYRSGADKLMFDVNDAGSINNVCKTFDLHNSVINNNFYNNNIGANFYNNTIGFKFINNIIGNLFSYNDVKTEFFDNIINNNFEYNTIGNTFRNNSIGTECRYNTIGNNFENNTILNKFSANNVQKNVNNLNGTLNNIKNNTFENNVSGTLTELVRLQDPEINVTCFRLASGNQKIRFFDETGLVIADLY